MKKTAILAILLFSIFNQTLSAPNENCFQLRIFPELRAEKISEISVIDSSRAIAVDDGALYKWSGGKWQEFYPPFPLDKININYLKAFSYTNIWIFDQEDDNYYHSLIYHFNGHCWHKIPSPQPYTLSSAGFIDSTQFCAAGDDKSKTSNNALSISYSGFRLLHD